jgi:N-acylneuraminate cytidylyltransferase
MADGLQKDYKDYMDSICIIPARGGSKRLPNKNLLEFKGESLVSNAVTTALKSRIFQRVILSSDSQVILDSVNNNPRLEKISRESTLATDDVRADDVVRHLINNLKLPLNSAICCLLPTTPLLEAIDLQNAFKNFLTGNSEVLFGVTNSIETPFRAFLMDNKNVLDPLFRKMLHDQSHTYPNTVTDAGQFYFALANIWNKNYSITSAVHSQGYLLDSKKCVDINTPEDWERFLMNNGN